MGTLLLAAMLSLGRVGAQEPPAAEPQTSPHEVAAALVQDLAVIEQVPMRSEQWPKSDVCPECVKVEVLVGDFQSSLRRLARATTGAAGDPLADAGEPQLRAAVDEVCTLAAQLAGLDFVEAFAEARYFLWTENVGAAQKIPALLAERDVLTRCQTR